MKLGTRLLPTALQSLAIRLSSIRIRLLTAAAFHTYPASDTATDGPDNRSNSSGRSRVHGRRHYLQLNTDILVGVWFESQRCYNFPSERRNRHSVCMEDVER
jgi:hypothetical protein